VTISISQLDRNHKGKKAIAGGIIINGIKCQHLTILL
jgi:hypothetical protein